MRRMRACYDTGRGKLRNLRYGLNRDRFLVADVDDVSVAGPTATIVVWATPPRSIVSFTWSPMRARPILFLNCAALRIGRSSAFTTMSPLRKPAASAGEGNPS